VSNSPTRGGGGIVPLSVRGAGGLVVYQSNGKGELNGVWIDEGATTTGTELATAGPAGSFIGSYSVTVFNSGGAAAFEGKLSIEHNGAGYALKWLTPAGLIAFQGVGLDAGHNSLAATWNLVN
jgi:hypothetical protein